MPNWYNDDQSHNERLHSLSLNSLPFMDDPKTKLLGMDSAVLHITSIIYDIRPCDQPDKYWCSDCA